MRVGGGKTWVSRDAGTTSIRMSIRTLLLAYDRNKHGPHRVLTITTDDWQLQLTATAYRRHPLRRLQEI